MSADRAEPERAVVAPDADADDAVAQSLIVERLENASPPPDRGFWGAFAAATALHALLLLGAGQAVPRHVGEADGSADGISVSVVTETDLRSQSMVPATPEPPPGQPAPVPQKPAPPVPESPPPQAPQQDSAAPPPLPAPLPEPVSEPVPDLKPSQLPDPTPASEPAPKPKAEQSLEAALENEVPDLLALPNATAKPQKKDAAAQPKKAEAAPKPQPQPQQKRVAKLDLSPPAPSLTAPSGGGGRRAGMERPAGITRSGANDDFARGVIRALQGTMPQLREVLGRVTVRITLTENGNVSDVQVLRTANNATIDQSVVFAAKQTSYPFPPPNSNLADRTFMVTYIYH